MNTIATKTANDKAGKALKFILVSGVATFVLTGLISLITQLQSGETDLRTMAYNLVLLALNACVNLVIYWLAKYNEANS